MIDHLLAIKEAVATAGAAGLPALPPADQERFLKDYDRQPLRPHDQHRVTFTHAPDPHKPPISLR